MSRSLPIFAILLALYVSVFNGVASAQSCIIPGISVDDAAELYALAIEPLHEAIWRVRGWRREQLILDVSRNTRPPLGRPASTSNQDLPEAVLSRLSMTPLVRRVCGNTSAPCEAGGAVVAGTFSAPVPQADGTYSVYFEARGDDSLRRPGDRTAFAAGWTIVYRKSANWEIVRVSLAYIT
jgi:hypothetical protein